MRIFLVGRIAILALVCCVTRLAFAQPAEMGIRAIGAGAFPLSFTHASAWFAHSANESEKVLIVLFFFQGSPGWLSQKTDFKWQVTGSPASIDMVVGKVTMRARNSSAPKDTEI